VQHQSTNTNSKQIHLVLRSREQGVCSEFNRPLVRALIRSSASLTGAPIAVLQGCDSNHIHLLLESEKPLILTGRYWDSFYFSPTPGKEWKPITNPDYRKAVEVYIGRHEAVSRYLIEPTRRGRRRR